MAKPYQILANLLALFAIVYVGVDTFYRMVRLGTVAPMVQEVVGNASISQANQIVEVVPDYQIINNRNIFGLSENRQDEKTAEVSDVDILTPTTLKLTLLGTIAALNGEGRAIIRDDITRKQNIYREGDALQGALLKNIFRGKVVLRVDGRDEILIMKKGGEATSQEQETSSPQRGGRPIINISLNRSEIEAMKDNLGTLLTSVKVRPYMRSGKRVGVIITKIGDKSGIENLGLQKGDVIESINNRAVGNMSDALMLYEKLKSGGPVSMEMIRRGKERQIRYSLK